ncbi:leucine-rich repeat domain-containing protein [Candidatus Poribacteria bacterium]|nr:leucine-rich repeat domain-containing protein [Candidatus Poribacteria bacterium]
MKRRKFLFLELIFFLIVCSLAQAADWMPDVHLEQAVREELDIPDEIPIHPGDIAELHNLFLIEIEHGIRSLQGLEYAVNLRVLVVDRSEVSDLAPLAGLENLEALSVVKSEVSDLAPLAGLENLRVLKLYENRISDIAPLAGLVNLERLELHDNQISDLTPLTGLVNLEVLQLHYNQISDITRIRSLTKLERLTIIGNPIDYTQLGNLPAELRPCRVDASGYKAPIAERIQNISYPSIGVRDYILAERGQDTLEIFTRFDLVFGALPLTPLREWTTRWLTAYGLPPVVRNLSTRVGRIDEVREMHTEVLRLNPNMILLIGLDFQNGLFERYGEDWAGWLRDKDGNRLTSSWRTYTGEEEMDNLIDFTKPIVIEQIVQQAKAISKCGLYDGIWLDHWGEGKRLQGIYTAEEEYKAKDTILQRIREVVPDDFFILVNNNRRKLQHRWAPYVNGIYMESGRDFLETRPGVPDGYTFAGIRDIEDALLWNETKLRKPTLNLLEGEVSYLKPIDDPAVKQIVRFFTTMALTHSNASVFMLHYDDFHWYDFYDAPLGQPVGGDETKAQLHENREGLFIREFTNGWAVYNRSGKAQEIEFSEEVSGWDSGVEKQRRHVLADLDGEIYLKSVLETAPTADVNADGVVNVLDLVIVANALGKTDPDLNGDGVVNIQDLVIVANAFE